MMSPGADRTPVGIPWPTGRLDARWRKILVALALSVLSEITTWIFVRGYGEWVLGQSLGLRSLCRWDCFWYGSILLYGYDAVPSRPPAGDAANWAFYPLFPLLAGLWHRLAGFGFEDSLIITGTLALPVVRPEDVSAAGAARARHFGEARPGSATIIVKALVNPAFLIEIEAVAAAPAR